jgi:zinc protease
VVFGHGNRRRSRRSARVGEPHGRPARRGRRLARRIELADALAQLGSQLSAEASADETTITLTALSHQLAPSFDLLADLVRRPHFTQEGLERTRDLRMSRLRQLSRTAATVADRAFVSRVFEDHPYGHGSLGTSASLAATVIEDVTGFWDSHAGPGAATLVVAGDVDVRSVMREAARVFDGWGGTASRRSLVMRPPAASQGIVYLADRPGAQQSELRVGHPSPSRRSAAFHALVTLNALLGGQFVSRINRNLREERAITYGARTTFDMRRIAGAFSCDTSVQADSTALAVSEILASARRCASRARLRRGTRAESGVADTRVRPQLRDRVPVGRAAVQIVSFELPDDVFDRFVPEIERLTVEDVAEVAAADLHPDTATVVVVGDAARCRPALEGLGRKSARLRPSSRPPVAGTAHALDLA